MGYHSGMETPKLTMADLRGKTEDELKAIVLDYAARIREKDRLIAELEELARLRTATKYAPSSEQMESLFPELEALDAAGPEEENTPEETRLRKKKSKPRATLCTAPADTPVVDIHHDGDAPGSYVKDGVAYRRDGDKVIDKIAFIPRRVLVERHHYAQYRVASDVEDDNGNKVIAYKNPRIDGMAAAPSLVAQVIVSKFDDHLPLYRQEEMFRREGHHITRQKLASWVIRYYEALQPLERKLKQKVYRSAFINKDETPVQVLDVKGPTGKPAKNGFMYITVGSTYDDGERRTHALVVLDYIQGRSRDVLMEDVLAYGYGNPIMTDGLKGYLTLDKHCVCWVHAVRQFKTILKTSRDETNARKLVTTIGKIYEEDGKSRKMLHDGELGREEFLAQRKEASLVHINSFFSIIEEIRGCYAPSGAMGKAISYIDTYRDCLTGYLDIVEAAPSNNVCERIAKTFATGRKNWLFAQSVDGADASAFFYSLIETAKLAGISPSDYIEYVCTFGPFCASDDQWESLLPWNIDLKRLEFLRSNLRSAQGDRQRSKPYIFCGATR